MNVSNTDQDYSALPVASQVLYEDNHIIVINKLPSQIVQGDKTGDRPLSELVAEYLRLRWNKPGDAFIGVVHRLDRPVSGAIMFAKTSKALSRLNEMLKQHEWQKKYWAVVKNPPPSPEATLIDYLRRDEAKNKSFVVRTKTGNAQLAELSYKLLAKSDNYYLLEVDLKTGRHHQIRAQLAAMGCPIKGDLKYGFPRSNADGSIHLHARQIEFLHPVRKESVRVIANPPNDSVWNHFASL